MTQTDLPANVTGLQGSIIKLYDQGSEGMPANPPNRHP